MKTFSLSLPNCPSCKSEDVCVVKTIKNYIIITIDVIFGFFLYPPFSYKLRCKQCGYEFLIERVNDR